MRMARTPHTLAALATAAVPGLDVTRVSGFGSRASSTGFDQALLDVRDGGRMIVRLPRTGKAEARAAADIAALAALTAGIRSRLPFAVPTLKGEVPVGGTRAIVYDHLRGEPLVLSRMDAASPVVESAGRAIAAIHALPTGFVSDAGLRTERAVDSLSGILAIMDRAAATGLVPAGLLERWERASEDSALWQFAPTVVNGAMSADSILHDGAAVTGIVDWHVLTVSDPAKDLYWAFGAAEPAVSQAILDAYGRARGSSDRLVGKRARLYAEMDVAKWLLHGTQQRSTEIVDDAVAMLSAIVDDVENDMMSPLSNRSSLAG